MLTERHKAYQKAEERIEEARRSGVKELDLSSMDLFDLPESLCQLTALTQLYLHNNHLTALPAEIGELTTLAQVYLYKNRLTALPAEIGKLTALTRLDLSDNQLTTLPVDISKLTALRRLTLSNNQLTTLPTGIGKLVALTEVNLSNNLFATLPPEVGKLTALTRLNIRVNQLTKLPPEIGNLTSLTQLLVFINQLTSLPPEIGELTALTQLDLRDNDLTTLPPEIGNLTSLKELFLHGNQLATLPVEIRQLTNLSHFDLHENPALGLPAEVLGPKWGESDDTNPPAKPAAILDYYFRIHPPAIVRHKRVALPLNEFKLILVGRGGVGKTTLVHRLVTGKYKEFKRTPGIKITQWPLKMDGEDVQSHVWDFGGQEIMHNTHRFFMTERALYFVLISSRENTEDHDAEYWLSLARSFAGDDAPIIVLLHKWDDARFELNRELLREKYGRNLVFLETDSESGHGIAALQKRICELAAALPGLKNKWPGEWRRVKDDLPKAKTNWLAFEDFCDFCRERGVEKREDQEILAERLHDLGLMLAYRKDEALRGFGVLNPQWVTKGIYDMLNAPELKAQNGRFTCDDFAKLLPARKYPAALHPYLLALMRKFRLCHPLDDAGRAYLIPDLLTKEEPKLDAEFPPEKCLGFIYRYESVLPEGLLPRFIVETYVHREPKHAWRTGVVLERANCRAFIRGDVLGRTVTIRVTGTGNGQRELLGIIREHFERIHRSFERLPVTELVPVPGYPQVVVPYAELLAYEAAGDDEYKVVIDRSKDPTDLFRTKDLVKLSVEKLLDGVDLPGIVREYHDLRYPSGLSLFISYSHKDDIFRDELRGALTAYERKDELQLWDDTRIEPGQRWEPEILGKLERANIIVLLLSNDFIRSDYCMQKEWEIAKNRNAGGLCAILPIVVRASRFDKLDLGQLQAIIPGGKPIKEHRGNRDAAWLEVTKQLDLVIARLKKQKQH